MVEFAKFESRAKTTSWPRVSAVAVRSPNGFLLSARPRAPMLAFNVEKSGAAFLRSVAAPSAAISTTPAQPALRLLHSVQAAQLDLIAAHVELRSPLLEIACRMLERSGQFHGGRTGIQAQIGDAHRLVRVGDVSLQAGERLVVGLAVGNGQVHGGLRGIERSRDVAVHRERAAHRQITPPHDGEYAVDGQVGDLRTDRGVVLAGQQGAAVHANRGAGEIGVHVVLDGLCRRGGGGRQVAQAFALHLQSTYARVGVQRSQLHISGNLAGGIRIEREGAAQAGTGLHQTLELRQLHLVAGDVYAEAAVLQIVGRVAIAGIGIDA